MLIKSEKILPFLVFLLPLTIYLVTLAPTYVATDSAEFALCMYYWGVCHPPGFGLYIALGHFFVTLFPTGSLIFKANLLSAIYGSLTVLFVYLCLLRLRVYKTVAFLISLLLATSLIFWRFSTFADVFTFGAFLVSVSLFFLFSARRLLAFLFLGLSASHLYLTGLALPVYIWYFWKREKNRKIWQFSVYVLLFFTGIVPQFLIFIRSLAETPVNWGHVKNFGEFFDYLRRREFGSFFLIANEVTRFNLGFLVKHFVYLLIAVFKNFSIIAIGFLGVLFWGGIYKVKGFTLLLMVFGLLSFFQIFSLSTLDPAGEIFDFDKFYVVLLVIFALIAGLSVNYLFKNFLKGSPGRFSLKGSPGRFTQSLEGFSLKGREYWGLAVMMILIFFNLLLGFKFNNFSKNYFTQNLITDAMSALPKGAVAVTVEHSIYFGWRFEREINNRFGDIELVYFLNNNKDFEKYNPKLFERPYDFEFSEMLEGRANLNENQLAVVDLLSKNKDRQIYILQGGFENKFFVFLKPFLKPYGLWWKFDADGRQDFEFDTKVLENLKNVAIKKDDLVLNQQKAESLTYAVAFSSAALELASEGRFNEALGFFEKSADITGERGDIDRLVDLTRSALNLSSRKEELIQNAAVGDLMQLATAYFSLGYFKGSVEIGERLVQIEPENAIHLSNLGSSYASLGQEDRAREYFEKALSINPDLELAKEGLEKIGE